MILSDNNRELRLLLVEDSESDAELITRSIRRAGFNLVFEQVQTQKEMADALNSRYWDIVLSDYNMPQFDAFSALNLLHQSGRDIPFIVVSGAIGEDTAVSLMKNGAHDYLMKDNLPRLIPAIERELRESELRKEKRKSEEQRLHLEEELRQAQKMEAIGQLAGGVAHDFNNMLFIITGCTEIMADEILPESPAYHNLNMIVEATERATTLVRQLLLFSRKSASNPVIMDMNEAISDLLKMIRRIIGENILLEFHPTLDLKKICADKGQMEQILMNLCINARDAMPDGGKIVIETQNISIDEDFSQYSGNKIVITDNDKMSLNSCRAEATKGDYILLSISDTGCGIPHDLRDRIFEPFFTTKEVGKGTGMGLAAVYGIVKSHSGLIHLYSEPQRGSLFKIYIPTSEETKSCVEPIFYDIKNLNGDKETILIAEDDALVRSMISKIVEKAGYQTICAENGVRATELFDQHREKIDIAILDVVMPKMGGDKVMEHIRKISPDFPIIFLTGYSRAMLPDSILSQSNFDTLQKPVARSNVLLKIKELLLVNKK
ncbi:MAG: response regulator [Desulfamplus sp.]|nr:response regulator [Desulfamplus sp.]